MLVGPILHRRSPAFLSFGLDWSSHHRLAARANLNVLHGDRLSAPTSDRCNARTPFWYASNCRTAPFARRTRSTGGKSRPGSELLSKACDASSIPRWCTVASWWQSFFSSEFFAPALCAASTAASRISALSAASKRNCEASTLTALGRVSVSTIARCGAATVPQPAFSVLPGPSGTVLLAQAYIGGYSAYI